LAYPLFGIKKYRAASASVFCFSLKTDCHARIIGHSNFGLAKFIRSLKKRQWIVAAGHQRFALTDNTRKMVARVCA
jgi:hypothetical protein